MAFPPRPVTFHFDHAIYCATVGTCSCSMVGSASTRFDPTTRTRVVDARKVLLPATETVWPRGQPGDLSKPLHPCVLELEEVKTALAKNELRREPDEPAAPASEPKAEPAPPAPDVQLAADPALALKAAGASVPPASELAAAVEDVAPATAPVAEAPETTTPPQAKPDSTTPRRSTTPR